MLALLLVAGCAKHDAAPPQPQSAYDLDTPFNEFMAHVVQPAALRFWAGSGTIYDATGLHDRAPTTDAGWEDVESGGLELIEIGNLLKLPGRVRSPEPSWIAHANSITALGHQAADAARRHDQAAILALGARLDDACEACHLAFMTPEQLGTAPKVAAKP